MTAICGWHDDYRLVVLSLIIAFITSYTALDLAGRVNANQGTARAAWLLGGAVAMGSGIWCMHYTGMLAFHLPISVEYHVPTVIFSLVAAVGASFVVLYVVSGDHLNKTHVIIGSVLSGGGIATMHYTGMAAMRLQAILHYNRNLWVLSIILAVVISFAGLLIIFHSRGEECGWKRKVTAALVLGLATPVMHYTGMAAVSFIPTTTLPNLSHSLDIPALADLGILFVTFLILASALITSLVDRRLSTHQAILDRERQMLRALIDNIPDFMFVKDLESRFIIANPQVAGSAMVRTPEEVIGKTDFDFFPYEQAKVFFDQEQTVMRTGQGMFNHEEVTRDFSGNTVPVLITKVPLRDSKGNIIGIAGVGRNISQRKRIEDALQEAERKYRTMFDEAVVGIFKLDPEGHLLNINLSMALFMGYSSAEEMVETMKDPLWSTGVSDERRKEFIAAVTEKGFVRGFEAEIYRRDRSKFWISCSTRTIVQNETLLGFEGTFEDITEHKLLREQLLQAQKLESVGQLAAGIAHEINTPTQYIGDNVRFLKDTFCDVTGLLETYYNLLTAARAQRLTPAAIEDAFTKVEKADLKYLLKEIPNAIEQTLEGVTRVSTLVSAMKEFSHPGTGAKTPLDLNHAIQSTITVARNEWKYVADMQIELDPLLPRISCLPGEFSQVILNLIVNAAHAIADRNGNNGEMGSITVETRDFPTGVEIRIGDTGSGIPLNIRTRVFDPFFTTKEIGKGTGQGLAIARSVIVDKHAGSINFETIEGKGTTFIIQLPHDGQTLNSKVMVQ